MSRTWNHRIWRVTKATERTWAADRDSMLATWGKQIEHGMCSVGRKCGRKALYIHCCNYVTGRAGRVSFRERLVCPEHARKVAKQHGIDLESVPLRHLNVEPRHTFCTRTHDVWSAA